MVKRSPKKRKRSWQPTIAIVALCSLVASAYFTIVWLGKRSQDAIADRTRYLVRFEDLECAAPPGLDRATFLAEVRFITDLPTELSSADAQMPKRIAEAFAKHPWVLSATASEAALSWPKPVALTFRVPSLAVATSDGIRVVDAVGVLLPMGTSDAKLAKFTTMQATPTVAAGERWRNADVERARELAREHQAKTLEKTKDGWRITQASGRVLALR